jgi:hypothetical protein
MINWDLGLGWTRRTKLTGLVSKKDEDTGTRASHEMTE